MSDQAYINLYKKIYANVQTAPRNSEGNASPAFMKFIKLSYTPEEAQILQHMERPLTPMPTRQIADLAGKPVDEVEAVLDALLKKNGVMGMTGVYTLPMMPMIVNRHQFYPDVKPDDVKAAELYQEFFIKDEFYKFYEASMAGTPSCCTICHFPLLFLLYFLKTFMIYTFQIPDSGSHRPYPCLQNNSGAPEYQQSHPGCPGLVLLPGTEKDIKTEYNQEC